MNNRPQSQRLKLSSVNPTCEGSTACAPYNFVPLPSRIVRVAELTQGSSETDDPDKLPCHARYDGLSGYFEVELETLSPLYVRSSFTRHELKDMERDDDTDEQGRRKRDFTRRVKNKPDFYTTNQQTKVPVIPGSTLRGMLRTLVEIISFSQPEFITTKHMFFRALPPASLGKNYMGRMNTKRAGFLKRDNDKWVISVCRYLKVPDNDIHQKLGIGPHDQYPAGHGAKPHLKVQHRLVWVASSAVPDIDGEGKRLYPDQWSKTETANSIKGWIVVSGTVPKRNDPKRHEFVFFEPEGKTIDVPDDVIERFEDDDQITQWQEGAFPMRPDPKDKKVVRERNGALLKPNVVNDDHVCDRYGEPVFFVTKTDDEEKVEFFGRAGMFRLPYKNSPQDLLPEELLPSNPTPVMDFAHALFGHVNDRAREVVEKLKKEITDATNEEIREAKKTELKKWRQGQPRAAYASRVSVTDAECLTDAKSVWLSDEPLNPSILAAPKPTAYAHYLVQKSESDCELIPYDDVGRGETTLRGYKMYWRQGPRTYQQLTRTQTDPRFDSQWTQCRPVASHVQFRFKVTFDNLTKAELGALCWALSPQVPEVDGKPRFEVCHQVGMGKPFGMGAVKLRPTLHLISRTERYKTIFDENGNWKTSETTGDATQFARKFENYVLKEAAEIPEEAETRLYDLERIEALLRMMQWPGVPADSADRSLRTGNTRMMKLNEFRHKPVLPNPFHASFDAKLGSWSGDCLPGKPLDWLTTLGGQGPIQQDERGGGTQRPREPRDTPRYKRVEVPAPRQETRPPSPPPPLPPRNTNVRPARVGDVFWGEIISETQEGNRVSLHLKLQKQGKNVPDEIDIPVRQRPYMTKLVRVRVTQTDDDPAKVKFDPV